MSGQPDERQVSMDAIVRILNRYMSSVLTGSGDADDEQEEYVSPNEHSDDSGSDSADEIDPDDGDDSDHSEEGGSVSGGIGEMKRKARGNNVSRLEAGPIVQDIMLRSGAYTEPRARSPHTSSAHTAANESPSEDDPQHGIGHRVKRRRRASSAAIDTSIDSDAGGSAAGVEQSGRSSASREAEADTPQPSKLAKGNMFDMLRFRERSATARGGAFSLGQKARLTHRMVPNTPSAVVDSYHYKAFCGRYSSDGKIFMTACQDHNVRLYDASANFRLQRTIAARRLGWSIVDTDYSPDQQYIVYSGWAPAVYLCNVAGGSEIHQTLKLQSAATNGFCPFTVRFSHDTRYIVAGCNDGCIYLYDLEANKRTLQINAHSDDVNAVAFADDTSQLIYSGGDDALIKVWDRRLLNSERPLPVGYLEGHQMGITYIDSKGDGRYLLSNGKDQVMRLWDIRSMTSCAARPPRMASTFDYRHEDPRMAASLASRSNVRDASVAQFRGHRVLYTLIRCRFSPVQSTGQMYAYTGSACGSVFVRDVSWHPFEPSLVSTSWDGHVLRWDWVREDDRPSELPSAMRGRRGLSDDIY